MSLAFPFPRPPRRTGFTLTELMFALAVLAIVTAFGAPSLKDTLRRGAIRAATLQVAGALTQARAASITSNRRGTFCLTGPAGGCLGQGAPAQHWPAQHWKVVVDEPGGGQRLVARGSLPSGVLLVSNRPSVHFWPVALAGTTATLTICDGAGRAPWRQLIVSQTGRVRARSEPGVAGCP